MKAELNVPLPASKTAAEDLARRDELNKTYSITFKPRTWAQVLKLFNLTELFLGGNIQWTSLKG